METFNLYGDSWDLEEEHGAFQVRDAWVGHRLGATLLGGSLYEVDPGRKLWPYHFHHANEEWLIVVRGRPTLRSRDGEQQLAEGDVVCFARGAAGGHAVRNETDESVRVLMLSSNVLPEVLEYPDSGKIAARGVDDERIFLTRRGPDVGYWDGED